MNRTLSAVAAALVAALTPVAALAVTLSDPRNSTTGVPLEPSLVSFIFFGGALLSAAAMIVADKRIRVTSKTNHPYPVSVDRTTGVSAKA